MKSVHKLTLSKDDLREAIRNWITEYHGLCFDYSTGDRISLSRWQEPITVTLKDELY